MYIMKDLYTHIKESLLDDEDEVFDGAKEGIVKEFLKNNYDTMSAYTIKETNGRFIVDVKGSIRLKNRKAKYLTNELFEFGSVGGDFSCSFCKELKSLKGAPQKVGGHFCCNDCESLTSLEGSPEKVGETFNCSYCKRLKTPEGSPEKVGGDFVCHYCGKKFTKDDVKKHTTVVKIIGV